MGIIEVIDQSPQVYNVQLTYYSCCNEKIDLDDGLCPICKEHCL